MEMKKFEETEMDTGTHSPAFPWTVFAVVSEQVLGRGWPFSAMFLGTG